MSSLALYRTLVPSHSAVTDATVEVWLELAARRHSAPVFGRVYAEAMVWWAAHFVELTPGTGAGSSSSSTVGPIISQKDGDVSRTYANTTAAVYPSSADAVRENLAEHVVQPVRFRDQIEVMYADGARIFVEVGPGRALTGLVGQILEGRPHRALSLEDPRGGGALDGLVRLLAQLAVAGVPIESGPLFAGRTRHELELDRAPGGPSPTTWRVDGQRAIPTVGEPPEHGMVLVTEPVAVSLSGGDRREQVVLEYLRTLREQAAAQREVLLSFLGEAPEASNGASERR